MTLLETIKEVDARIIAIDGRSAAGKTTLAGVLASGLGASVVHMDDFFLPLELRTPERLAEPGGNVHYERFESEVLPFLRTGEAFSYRRFDCSSMDYCTHRSIVLSGTIVVEGAYSLSPRFGRYWDLSIFLDIDKEEQLERILKRGGPEKAEAFGARWIPMEEKYIAAFGIMDRADIVLDGGAGCQEIC